jgi:uncharacterized protein (TIGR02118 family)
MKIVFTIFNYKGRDLAEGESHYLRNHVPLTLQLPNLRQYITGVIRWASDRSGHRAAFSYFDDAKSLRSALHESPQAQLLLKDGTAHLRVNRWLELDSDIIVPFTERHPGLQCFVLTKEFELKSDEQDPEVAERSYLSDHVAMVRQLPNLRHFTISKYQLARRSKASSLINARRFRNPLRVMTLVFDDFEQFQYACNSSIGQKLKAHEQRTTATVRVYHIDGTVQL